MTVAFWLYILCRCNYPGRILSLFVVLAAAHQSVSLKSASSVHNIELSWVTHAESWNAAFVWRKASLRNKEALRAAVKCKLGREIASILWAVCEQEGRRSDEEDRAGWRDPQQAEGTRHRNILGLANDSELWRNPLKSIQSELKLQSQSQTSVWALYQRQPQLRLRTSCQISQLNAQARRGLLHSEHSELRKPSWFAWQSDGSVSISSGQRPVWRFLPTQHYQTTALERSVSDDADTNILRRLKLDCGSE